jgi:signal transduction histidine kinase
MVLYALLNFPAVSSARNWRLLGGAMRHLSERMTWTLFGFTVAVLIIVVFFAFTATSRYASSEQWVSHTQEVELGVSRLRAEIFTAESSRFAFILSGEPASLDMYNQASQEIPYRIIDLQNLTVDNPSQQQRIGQLRTLIDRRLGVLQESIALKQNGQASAQDQYQLTKAGETIDTEIVGQLRTMRDEEETLMKMRRAHSERTYKRVQAGLGASFALILLLLFANFAQLLVELRDRKQAELAVRDLSSRLLQVQDVERRKIARELHDGIGQLFAGLKMSLNQIVQVPSVKSSVAEPIVASCFEMIDQGISEARTLSHLLHPPLLEELGFASAARWFVEGYSQRSSVKVRLEIPDDLTRVSQEIELTLFRCLQEALTNIHRHSGSASADIHVAKNAGQIFLTVRDYGKGISEERLEKFRRTSSGVGVGLAGMRERVRHLNGNLDIESDRDGTLVQVSIPLTGEAEAPEGDSGPREPNAAAPAKSEPEAGRSSRAAGQLLFLGGREAEL